MSNVILLNGWALALPSTGPAGSYQKIRRGSLVEQSERGCVPERRLIKSL